MALDRKKLTLWGLAIGIVAVLAYMMRPTPEQVDLATVERGAMRVTLDEEGETRVRDRFVFSAPVAGRVLRIEHEPGDPVVAGETVVATFQPADSDLLDPRNRATSEARVRAARAAMGSAEAEVHKAKAELAFSESELVRYTKLHADGIVSKSRLDTAALEVDTRREAVQAAEYAVVNARGELEAAEAALLQTVVSNEEGQAWALAIRSPVDGVVLERYRESEAVVPAGERLISVGDPQQLEIVADFLSTDAVQMKPGDPVIIDQWGADDQLAGRVQRIEPFGFTKISALGVEEQRVNVIIDLADPYERWKSLGDGYRVEVRVVIWQGDDVLKVPTSSLFRRQGQWEVFVENDGRARRQPIEVGRRNGLEAEVLDGLSAGDRVVAYPSDAIEDGVRITERT